jgi:hypothetical protein
MIKGPPKKKDKRTDKDDEKAWIAFKKIQVKPLEKDGAALGSSPINKGQNWFGNKTISRIFKYCISSLVDKTDPCRQFAASFIAAYFRQD